MTTIGEQTGEVRELALELIDRNPQQPRRRFDQGRLAALAASLEATDGVVQPVIVRPVGERYQLIAGERRWRASFLAGRATVPAIVRDVDDATAFALAAIENMVREDLTPVEEARTVAVLCEAQGLSKAEVARRVGRTRESISNLVRLLELPDEALELIDAGRLSEGHGRALLMCPNHDRRRWLARRAVADGWSVRRLEAEARGERVGPRGVSWHPDQLAFAAALADALGKELTREVDVAPDGDGYEVRLRVEGRDDASALLRRLGVELGDL